MRHTSSLNSFKKKEASTKLENQQHNKIYKWLYQINL